MAASKAVASCWWATCGMGEEVKVNQIVGADSIICSCIVLALFLRKVIESSHTGN